MSKSRGELRVKVDAWDHGPYPSMSYLSQRQPEPLREACERSHPWPPAFLAWDAAMQLGARG